MARGRRHWKQRWDPDADFVFLKRLKLGLKGMMTVEPGDDVPKDNPLIAKKLRKWWNAEVIGLKGFELKKTGFNQPIHPEVKEAFRLRCLEELQAIEPEATAALGDWHEGSLYGLLVSGETINAFYKATMPPLLPDDVEVPWEQVPEEELPVAILDTFDLPPEKPEEPEESAEPSEGPEPSEGEPEGEEEGESSEPPAPKAKHLGGGWYELPVPGEDAPRRVHGKAALEALLEELGATE